MCPATDPEKLVSVMTAEDTPEGAGDSEGSLPASTPEELRAGQAEDTSALDKYLPLESSPAVLVDVPSTPAVAEAFPIGGGGAQQAAPIVEDARGEVALEVSLSRVNDLICTEITGPAWIYFWVDQVYLPRIHKCNVLRSKFPPGDGNDAVYAGNSLGRLHV